MFLPVNVRPVSRYVLVFLEDPLRGERLNVAVITWSDAFSELYWRFIDNFDVLVALHLSMEAVVSMVTQLQLLSQVLTKATLAEQLKKERGPYTWVGFTKPYASTLGPDVLAADIYRLILARPVPPPPEIPETPPTINESSTDVVSSDVQQETPHE